jgi:hypothetical protein
MIADYLCPGYGLALLLDGEHTAQQMVERMERGEACPVLAEARGARGVLQAMQIRTGPLRLQDPPYVTKTLAYARPSYDGKRLEGIAMEVWLLTPKGKEN